MKLIQREKGTNKPIESEKVKIDNMTLGELKQSLENVQQKHNELLELLKDKVIISKDDELIVAINDKLKVGKITHAQLYKGENVKLYKIENGNIVVDKKKVGAL